MRAAQVVRQTLLSLLAAVVLLGVLEGALWVAAELYAGRPTHGADVLCIGDSNTQGIGASADAAYPAQLQRLLRQRGMEYTVSNEGVSGFPLRRMLDRMRDALEKGPARYVVLMGGINDVGRPDVRLWNQRRQGLRRLRLVRFVALAWHYLRWGSEHARKTYYFAALDPFEMQMLGHGAEAVARVQAKSEKDDRDYYFLLTEQWRTGHHSGTRELFEDMLRAPPVYGIAGTLRLPIDFYRWELAMLAGEASSPPSVHDPGSSLQHALRKFAQFHQSLRERRFDEALHLLRDAEDAEAEPYFTTYCQLWRAWVSLIRGDVGTAHSLGLAVLERARDLNPHIGLDHSLALVALTWLLLDPSNTLPPPVQGWHGLRREAREEWAHGSDDGRAWMDLAATMNEGKRQLEPRLPRIPFLAPTYLRTLLKPPDADFLRAHLEREIRPFVALQRQHRFTLILSTYLDERNRLLNEGLVAAARVHGLKVVDLQARYGDLLHGPGRRAFFSEDDHHPNAEGYALVAEAVAEAITELEAESDRP